MIKTENSAWHRKFLNILKRRALTNGPKTHKKEAVLGPLSKVQGHKKQRWFSTLNRGDDFGYSLIEVEE